MTILLLSPMWRLVVIRGSDGTFFAIHCGTCFQTAQRLCFILGLSGVPATRLITCSRDHDLRLLLADLWCSRIR